LYPPPVTDAVQIAPGAVLEGPALAEPIRVVAAEPVGGRLKIAGEGLRSGHHQQLYLDPAQLAAIRVSPPEGTFDGDAERFRLAIEATRLALAHEYDPYFSLSISRVDPLPHQIEAVYDAMLPLPRVRFLLADDAGAGKTVMAGLLLRELKLRGLVERTLIVAPANLCFQWRRELFDRFREPFEVLRGDDLRNAYGTNPWHDRAQVITSMDWAKRDEVKASLERAPRWDLVIVDEAHRMSAADPEHKTDRYLLGELLSERTDHLLLLTATPHRGDKDNFALFLRLLDRDAYAHVESLEEAIRRNRAPFYLRRTKEALVGFPDPETGVVRSLFTKRDARTVAFDLDEAELAFYESLTRYVQDQSIRAAADPSARGRALGFTMAMYQRRFASSLYAARRSLERRLAKIEDRLAGRGSTRATAEVAATFDERRLAERDELTEEEATAVEEAVEEASLAADREDLLRERSELRPLIEEARRLEARDDSSKLRKLRQVLTDERVFADPTTKLLVFTEHKDTLDYLVAKLREWGLRVTQIHGGMAVGDSDAPGTRLHAEREFRDSAQVLVATEAAGEGINLQFCWLMVNYDIPWNPMRLEQRIGRIHRYGQEKDCLIFNFVAQNTREGQVLGTLLARLDEIRSALGSDQVFDVVGEVVPPNFVERLLRDHYAGRVTKDEMLERVATAVEQQRFARITQSALEGLARRQLNLAALVAKRAEAKERRLVPEVIRDFFLRAAPAVELSVAPDGPVAARVLGRLPRRLSQIGHELAPRFGRLGREYRRIVFDRAGLEADPTLEWVTPGHPLFEAVREAIWREGQPDLRRGACFYDLHRDRPARLDVFAASVKDGTGQTLHRRLFVVEAVDGSLALRQPTLFLDLAPAPPGAVPDLAAPTPAASEAFLLETALEPFLAEVRREREAELETIRRHVEIALQTLIDRQQVQIDALIGRQQRGEDVGLALQEAERRLDELNERLDERRRQLDGQGQFVLADVTRLGSAWVLPHPDRTGELRAMVSDPAVEAVAMQVAIEHERARGWQPEDVSAENRGFDILSRSPDGAQVRFIEVKGRAGTGQIALTANEFRTAERLGRDYYLYVVYDCATAPRLIVHRDPARLAWQEVVRVDHYVASVDVVEGAGAG
jgi:superfamily II DNA or RNA helicase